MQPGSPLVGQSLGYLEVRGKRSFLIVALRRANGQTISSPDPRLELSAGDTVIVLGHKDDIPQLAQRYQVQRPITYCGAQA
ncbi:MAG: cation:proton antiporter regulatory subunit [Cyanophyceae cyanobacterium]